ncbi:DUF998 domain-containing protein [Glycomyces sp. TRM65418]|uniref:DUF998 domain-containing protein n=1 Tax=Glycomyces sp. TRM65418 TaxID=2867006 RepID=UPI001CE5C616|nr:DUF998 domain-containing protein [Glycomyces sp. TRM65418]MCC3765645.1 DUF998 domain-containing protein [Glycomyces sp. TRM65418]QZD55243.1 DUF998 domain-containing protein [Glycomyces sp. TRM65418]
MRRELFRTRAAEVTAMAGVAAGQAGFAVMHLTQSDTVDPVATPVSSYAVTWPGVLLFPASVLSLALACAILAGRGVGLAREGCIRFLLGATAVMLVGAAVFRTGTPESGLTWWAQVHRYTAGAAFVMLTVVAALCAVRMKDADVPEWVRRGTWWVTALAASTFLTTTVNTFLPAFLDGGDWRGAGQRVLLVVLSALVWMLIANSARVGVRTAEPVRVPALPATGPAVAATNAEAGVPAFAGARS